MNTRTTILPSQETAFRLGTRFVSPQNGPLFWTTHSSEHLSKELAAVATCGFDTIRLPLPVSVFMPGPNQVNPDAIERFRMVLALSREAGLNVTVCLLSGPLCTPNGSQPGWSDTTPHLLFADPTFIRTAASLARQLVVAARSMPVVKSWEITRGIPRWDAPLPLDTTRSFFEALRSALRENDPDGLIPISPGDGLVSIDPEEPGHAPEILAPATDSLSVALELRERETMRHSQHAAFACARLRPLGRPFSLSEFGSPPGLCSDEVMAAETRSILYSALLGGAWGVSYRASQAITAAGTTGELLDHAGHALNAGALGKAGSWLAPAREVRSFADMLASQDLSPGCLRLPPAEAALILPDELSGMPLPADPTYGLSRPRPVASRGEREESAQLLRECFTLLSSTGLSVDVVPESVLLRGGVYRLIVAPLGHRHRATTWRRLMELAHTGATVYVPWSGGHDLQAAGFGGVDFRELTGCHHKLRPELPSTPKAWVSMELKEGSVGCEVPPDERDVLPISRCMVSVEDAEVLSKDTDGRAALLKHKLGRGRVIFSCYPWERLVMRYARSRTRSGLPLLYRLLRQRAGITAWATTDNPRVQATAFGAQRDNGRAELYVLVANHGYGKETARIKLAMDEVLRGIPAKHIDPRAVEIRQVHPDMETTGQAPDRFKLELRRKQSCLFKCESK